MESVKDRFGFAFREMVWPITIETPSFLVASSYEGRRATPTNCSSSSFREKRLRLESKKRRMHLRRHGNLDGIHSSRDHRSSQSHTRNPKCPVKRDAKHLGALQRRKRYLERIRHRRPPDRWGAHRLDAAGAGHFGARRSSAIRSL